MPFDQITEDALAAQVRRFYGEARHDAVLGPIFEAAIEDWEEHFAKLTDFWTSVLLGSGRYRGNPLAVHLAQPAIRPDMFARWLTLWGETAEALFVPELAAILRDRAGRIGQSLQAGMFFRPDEALALARRGGTNDR
jgi:hemoglobin